MFQIRIIYMKLTKEAIEEFKSIYQEEFGEILPDDEAYEKASNLLRLFKVIYRPLPRETVCKNDRSMVK